MPVSDVSNARAVSIFVAYLSINFSLFLLVIASIGDFSRHPSRKTSRSVLLFNLLEGVSLAVTWYYMLSFFGLSYRSWAFDNGVLLPVKPSFGSLSQVSEALTAIKLGPWLKDVKLFRDAWETVVETPARTCWSMPIFFVTTGWSLFLAKEAPRRGIKYSWAYMLLGQLVAISFAMNLFFLAVVLHPVQSTATVSKSRGQQDKPDARVAGRESILWVPSGVIYWLLLGLTFASIGLTCISAGDKNFLLLLAVPHVLLLLPPVLHLILPNSFGQFQPDHSTYAAYYNSKLIVTMLVGIAFEAVALYIALNNTPSPTNHLHRHSNVFKYPWHAASAFIVESPSQNLWRSLWDHPAVSSVGWDSILCTASFATWLLVS